MSVQLNHTIVWCKDQAASAGFITDVLGLPPARRFMHFLVVDLANGVSLDYYQIDEPIRLQHYAFLVGEDEFDSIYGRLRERRVPIWAWPGHRGPGEINRNDGGRGVYFDDPDGHVLEIITRPYADPPEE